MYHRFYKDYRITGFRRSGFSVFAKSSLLSPTTNVSNPQTSNSFNLQLPIPSTFNFFNLSTASLQNPPIITHHAIRVPSSNVSNPQTSNSFNLQLLQPSTSSTLQLLQPLHRIPPKSTHHNPSRHPRSLFQLPTSNLSNFQPLQLFNSKKPCVFNSSASSSKSPRPVGSARSPGGTERPAHHKCGAAMP
jgi:hypothetical protein